MVSGPKEPWSLGRDDAPSESFVVPVFFRQGVANVSILNLDTHRSLT